jgi:hypothetical protein
VLSVKFTLTFRAANISGGRKNLRMLDSLIELSLFLSAMTVGDEFAKARHQVEVRIATVAVEWACGALPMIYYLLSLHFNSFPSSFFKSFATVQPNMVRKVNGTAHESESNRLLKYLVLLASYWKHNRTGSK